jgi:hypothetical protein
MAENEALADAALPALCRLLVSRIVGWIRKHEGVLRAAPVVLLEAGMRSASKVTIRTSGKRKR